MTQALLIIGGVLLSAGMAYGQAETPGIDQRHCDHDGHRQHERTSHCLLRRHLVRAGGAMIKKGSPNAEEAGLSTPASSWTPPRPEWVRGFKGVTESNSRSRPA